ncbi:MAG: Mur ligase family protein, partial [Gemmatimonadales bacterium]
MPGPNLLMDRPGAVLEITCADQLAEPVIAGWRSQAERLLEAVGWGGEELAVRRYPGGASLALSAPIDVLLAATEINEWALEAAGAVLNGSPQPSLDEAARRIRELIAGEANPGLRALREAALSHGVQLLADPELVSVGSGTGSLTWPRDQLPSPADIDWSRVHDVPIALVTGSNGKTTTVRLLGAVVAAAGRVAGWSCTDNVTVAGASISEGDWAGPGGARMVLRDQRVEIAILETARGGILRRGLAVTRADAAIVTNIAEDHFGEWGVYDLPTLAEAKLVVSRAVGSSGRVVLNADDVELVAAARRVGAPITWISLDPSLPLVRQHLEAGGDACLLEAGELVLRRAGVREAVAPVADVPLTMSGAARHNVYNALGVIGLASAIGIPAQAVARGLRAFRGTPEENP